MYAAELRICFSADISMLRVIWVQLFHGIFEAASPGQMNIDSLACGGSYAEGAPFPAQVQCKYHFKYPPTPRWMFQKVPGLFFNGTLRIDRLLSEDQARGVLTSEERSLRLSMRKKTILRVKPSVHAWKVQFCQIYVYSRLCLPHITQDQC